MSHDLGLDQLEIGQDIVLEDSDALNFSGTVHSLDLDRRLLKLEHCVDMDVNKLLPGLQIFPEKEIRSLAPKGGPKSSIVAALLDPSHTNTFGNIQQSIVKPKQTAEIFKREMLDGFAFPEFSCIRKQCWVTAKTPPKLTFIPVSYTHLTLPTTPYV